MEKLTRNALNNYVFIRFYPDRYTNRKDVIYFITKHHNERIGIKNGASDNFLKFLSNYRSITESSITPKRLIDFANEVILQKIRLKRKISKNELKALILDVIRNSLSIKIGYETKIDKLYGLGRSQNIETHPLKINNRKPVKANIGDTVFVCANNEKPFVTSPGTIIHKEEEKYLIFYFTNLFGGKESKLIEINEYNFQEFNDISFGLNRVQAIENKKFE